VKRIKAPEKTKCPETLEKDRIDWLGEKGWGSKPRSASFASRQNVTFEHRKNWGAGMKLRKAVRELHVKDYTGKILRIWEKKPENKGLGRGKSERGGVIFGGNQ